MKIIYDGIISCSNAETKAKIIDGLTDADYAVWVREETVSTTNSTQKSYTVYYLKQRTMFEKLS